jgi:hypothetical protein
MKEFGFNHLDNFIAGWYIDTDVVDSITKEFTNNKNIWVNATDSFRGYSSLGSPCFSEASTLKYRNQLDICVENYKLKYPSCVPVNDALPKWGVLEPYNFQHYLPGNYYSRLHCENNGTSDYTAWRTLVFMTYLNDVHEGGETEFTNQKIKVKPEKGLTIMWPAYWTHVHRGLPTLSEEKMIVTGWFSYENVFMT